jgi:hypothetical protein
MQSFNENMLRKFLGFGRMKTKYFCFVLFFFEILKKPGILIPDLYFTV